MNDIQNDIKKVAKKIAEKYQPEKIILFGSHAWGRPDENSDVDLFIVKKTENTRNTAREINRFIFPRPFPMDIIVYKPEDTKKRLDAGDYFLQNIFSKGKVLYAAN